jgi:hypothetical protein
VTGDTDHRTTHQSNSQDSPHGHQVSILYLCDWKMAWNHTRHGHQPINGMRLFEKARTTWRNIAALRSPHEAKRNAGTAKLVETPVPGLRLAPSGLRATHAMTVAAIA